MDMNDNPLYLITKTSQEPKKRLEKEFLIGVYYFFPVIATIRTIHNQTNSLTVSLIDECDSICIQTRALFFSTSQSEFRNEKLW